MSSSSMSKAEKAIDTASAQLTHGSTNSHLPGSDGEHYVQDWLETADRAALFYENAMHPELNDRMRRFISDRWFGIVGSTTADGTPYAAPWIGVEDALDEDDDGKMYVPRPSTLPGSNCVGANPDGPSATVLFMDWWNTTVGLHVNGHLHEGDRDERMTLDVEEAYIHCAKHIPQLTVVEEPDHTNPARTSPLETYDRMDDELERYVRSQILTFLTTADRFGETDISPRLGPHGFLQPLDDRTIAWPEFRGNGVSASMGNVLEQPKTTLTFIDWWNSKTVTWITGEASVHESLDGVTSLVDDSREKAWIKLSIDRIVTASCPSLPLLGIEDFDPPWGTDDERAKKCGFFA